MVPIFYYHSVGGEPPQTLDRDLFRLHLETIHRHAYQTVTVAQLLSGDYPPNSCALTFDDGLLDNYDIVFPLLQEFGYVATFFVVPGYDKIVRWVNPETGAWSDTALPGYTVAFQNMKTEHRQELAAHGMEIASHTLTHRKLTQIPKSELSQEILGAKQHLETEVGKPVNTFCYPNGRFNLSVLRAVKKAGYTGACSTIPGYFQSNRYPYVLPRFLVEQPQYFEDVLLGRAFHPKVLFRLLFSHLKSWLP